MTTPNWPGMDIDPDGREPQLTQFWEAMRCAIAQAKAAGISPWECWQIAATACDEINPAPSPPVNSGNPDTDEFPF